jgi:hypothetical protein
MSRRRKLIGSGLGVGLGLQLWLDASDPSTITDSGGSVSQWDDKSGMSNDTTQGTGSAQPATTASTENGRNILDYDGSDVLLAPSGIFAIPQGNSTTFVVAKRATEDGSLDAVFGMAAGASNDFFILFSNISGAITATNRAGGGSAISSVGNTNTDMNIITFRRSGTTQGISVNGETEITNTSALDTGTITSAGVGAAGTGAFPLIGNFAELLVYNRSLSAAEIVMVNTYLSNKWGVII